MGSSLILEPAQPRTLSIAGIKFLGASVLSLNSIFFADYEYMEPYLQHPIHLKSTVRNKTHGQLHVFT